MKRILMLSAVTIITLALPFTAYPQAKTKIYNTPPKSTSTQTVTTEDGRKALLKSDGTWQYGNNDTVVKNTLIIQNSILKLETGVVFRSGDVKPISRTIFYLLDSSLAQILLDAGYQGYKKYVIKNELDLYEAYLFDHKIKNYFTDSMWKSDKERYDKTWLLIKPHIVQSVTTDFSGNATFNKMSPGKYYLLGCSHISKNSFIWATEINLIPGDNSLTLDQDNASFTSVMPEP
ncbi:MAG: hypothetical protein WCK54_14070 [Desulfuromonadales bacterium]